MIKPMTGRKSPTIPQIIELRPLALATMAETAPKKTKIRNSTDPRLTEKSPSLGKRHNTQLTSLNALESTA